MFNITQQDTRRFFCETYRKMRAHEILSPIEMIAAKWIEAHPAYHSDLNNLDKALSATYPLYSKETNPFLHLSLHLSISEQIQINQPIGISVLFKQLIATYSEHETYHIMMAALTDTLLAAQQTGHPLDSDTYMSAIKKHIQ